MSSTGAGGQWRAGVEEGPGGRAFVFADRWDGGEPFVLTDKWQGTVWEGVQGCVSCHESGVWRFVSWGGDRQTLPDGGRIPTGRTAAPLLASTAGNVKEKK